MSEADIDPEDRRLIEGEDGEQDEEEQPGRPQDREERQHAEQPDGDTNAAQAKKNEQRDLESGKELPG